MRSIGFETVLVSLTVFTVFVSSQTWKPVLQSTYGPQLLECKNNWQTISTTADADRIAKCYRALVLAVGPRMKDPTGIRPLNIPSLDPLTVEHAVIGNSPMLKGSISHGILTGTTSGFTPKLYNVVYHPKNMTLIMTMPVPRTEITANYENTLNLASLFGGQGSTGSGAKSRGRITGFVANGAIQSIFNLKMSPLRGLQVASAVTTLKVTEAKLNFKAGDTASESLANLMNTIAAENNNALLIAEEVIPVINKAIAHNIGTLLNKGWKHLDEL